MYSTAYDTVNIEELPKQAVMLLCLVLYKTNPKNIGFLIWYFSQIKAPNPAAKQAEPASLKFLITSICFVILGIRENLQPDVSATLPKEALPENLKDFIHITSLFRFIMPLFVSP